MPDRIPNLVAYLMTKAGELRRMADEEAEPIRSKLIGLAQEFEAKAEESLGLTRKPGETA